MDALLIFARHPRPGFCKTRLIPALGAAGAALARSHGARVIHCGARMGRQTNIGAAAAKGNLNLSAVTSARRWQRGGVIRTTALHLAAMTLFLLGTPADGIARALQRLGRIPSGSETGASLKDDVKGA